MPRASKKPTLEEVTDRRRPVFYVSQPRPNPEPTSVPMARQQPYQDAIVPWRQVPAHESPTLFQGPLGGLQPPQAHAPTRPGLTNLVCPLCEKINVVMRYPPISDPSITNPVTNFSDGQGVFQVWSDADGITHFTMTATVADLQQRYLGYAEERRLAASNRANTPSLPPHSSPTQDGRSSSP